MQSIAMQRIEYRNVCDKSEWGKGPWQTEPDKIQWLDEATGLPCLIVRDPMLGFLCGYVGVMPDHPLYGLDYSDPIDNGWRARLKRWLASQNGLWHDANYQWDEPTPERFFEVHGGLTYADSCRPGNDERSGICHKPSAGEPDGIWWFGFDTGHAFDLVPGRFPNMPDYPNTPEWMKDHYRDICYVQEECENLAQQLWRYQ